MYSFSAYNYSIGAKGQMRILLLVVNYEERV